MPRILTAPLCVGLLVVACGQSFAQEQKIDAPPEASNMRLVGHSDLQARSAYQPAIHRQGDRWSPISATTVARTTCPSR